jgi:hypothetical protein
MRNDRIQGILFSVNNAVEFHEKIMAKSHAVNPIDIISRRAPRPVAVVSSFENKSRYTRAVQRLKHLK